MPTSTTSKAAATLGRKGGKVRSEAKTAAVRANGLKGGRPRVTNLRKIADRLGFTVYSQGGNWILSDRETEALHHSVTTERDALLVGLSRALDRDILTPEEAATVQEAR